jgi:hypothetical protein
MRKRVLLYAIWSWGMVSVLFFVGCQPQIKPCTTTVAEVSDLRGFKVGMSLDEVSKRFPGIQPHPSYDHPEISSRIEINPRSGSGYSTKGTYNADVAQHPELEGVQKVELQFIENSIASVRVTYNDTHDMNFGDTFFPKLTSSLNLKGEWSPASSEQYEREKVMQCQGFDVKAEVKIKDVDTNKIQSGRGTDAFTYTPYVQIELPNMEKVLKDKEWERGRQKQEKEKEKSDAFKP